MVVFIGVSVAKGTKADPLDFQARSQMIRRDYENAIILPLPDMKLNECWSKQLDAAIGTVVKPGESVVLYGSRDSFAEAYTGTRKFVKLTEVVDSESGTQRRDRGSVGTIDDPKFRAGVMWAAYNKYPQVFPTVDVAIFNEKGTELLMARKPNETKWRFIGGFADPKSESYEEDAIREVMEEADIEISAPEYVGSFFINDWRYKNSNDKVKTAFFQSTYVFGSPKAKDDVEEVRWFPIKKLNEGNVVSGHTTLLVALLAKRKKK